MIASIITLTIAAGLLWLPWFLKSGPDWVQIGGLVLAIVCAVLAVALFVDWAAHEVVRIRRLNYQATVGVNLSYATNFVQALGNLTTGQTMELFNIALLTAKGMPGIPIMWRIEFPGGPVSKSVLVDFLDACIEVYSGDCSELWPVRDHDRAKFGGHAEKELKTITDWLVMNGYANPARGDHAATWAMNVHPLDIKRNMGLDV